MHRWIQPVTVIEKDGQDLAKFDDFGFIMELQNRLVDYLHE
jgi:hypothetical protein